MKIAFIEEPHKLGYAARVVTVVGVLGYLFIESFFNQGFTLVQWSITCLIGLFFLSFPLYIRSKPHYLVIFTVEGLVISFLIFINQGPISPLYLLYFLSILSSPIYCKSREISVTTFLISGFYLATILGYQALYGIEPHWPDILARVGFFVTGGGLVIIINHQQRAQQEILAKLEAQNQELAGLMEVSKTVASTLELDEVLKLVGEKVRELTHGSACMISLLDREEIVMINATLTTEEIEALRTCILIGNGLAGRVARTGHPLAMTDMTSLPEVQSNQVLNDILVKNQIISALAVPIKFKSKVIGVFSVYHDHPRYYSKNEINLLCAMANQAASAINNASLYNSKEDQLKVANREINLLENEMELAAEVQQSLIPQSPVSLENMKTFMGIKLAGKVGGDFFDYFQLDDGKWGLIIGDVMGNGLKAAMLMTQTRAVIRALALQGGSPAKVLKQANAALYPDFSRMEMFCTLIYRVIDEKNHTLTYSNAAHCPTIFYRPVDASFVKLDKGGFAIGMFPDSSYENGKYTLEKGDLGVGYTDGLIEAANESGENYGIERLQNLMQEVADNDAEVVFHQIMSSVEEFTGGEFNDDLSLLVTKYK